MKKKLFAEYCLITILWVMTLFFIFKTVTTRIVPVYTVTSLYTNNYTETPPLAAGDVLSCTFSPSENTLSEIDFAFSYSDTVSDSAQLILSILRGEEILVEQPLSLKALPNSTFVSFDFSQKHCKKEQYTIQIKNTSSDSRDTFSVLSTDCAPAYLDTVSDYKINDISYTERILCQFHYITGYSFYKVLSAVFLLFLFSTAITILAVRRFHRSAKE